jgi:tetratricopeptide (TPR) repeat protein
MLLSRGRRFRPAILLLAVACSRAEPLPPVRVELSGDLDPDVASLVKEHVARVEAAPASSRAHGTLGLVYEANLLWLEAAASFENAAKLDPRDPLWRFHRAVALKEAGESAEAGALLRDAAAELPDAPGVQHRLGQTLLEDGDLAGARAAFGRARLRLPNQPEILVGLASIDVAEGNWASAEGLCRQALRADPANKLAHYALGRALAGLGRSKESAEELAIGLDAKVRYVDDPLGAELRSYRVGFHGQAAEAADLAARRRFAEAAALLAKIVAKRPEDAEMRSNLGAALLELGRVDEAVRELEAALALDETRFATHINLANALLRAGKPEDAMRHADRAVALGAHAARAHMARAQVLAAKEEFEEAYAALQRAVALDARDLTILVMLTEVCSRLDRIEEAEAWCRKAIEVDPTHLPSRVNLATFALISGRTEEARVQTKELQRLAPDEPRVRMLAKELGMPEPVRR